MSIDEFLGHHHRLAIRRFASPGAILAVGDEDVLLIGSEIPEGAKEGDEVDVFIYLDSEARPLATTRRAKLELGEVTFLQAKELTKFGAFFDWGMAKDLLVPFKEQTADVHAGNRYPIGLYLDDTGRFAGTMRVSEMLDRDRAEWRTDEWVEGEAWREDAQHGLFVIVERAYVGRVPREEPHNLRRGDAAKFRVTTVLPNGRIELSLRGHAHEEREHDAGRILERLKGPSPPRIGDKSSPEDIRDLFGLSKKAFKRAIGGLLKEGVVTIDSEGYVLLKPQK
ncbi:MAG: S1-like domain-containing RNA-binding protein [Labilithrix sp.]